MAVSVSARLHARQGVGRYAIRRGRRPVQFESKSLPADSFHFHKQIQGSTGAEYERRAGPRWLGLLHGGGGRR